jgi:hypothetical protein
MAPALVCRHSRRRSPPAARSAPIASARRSRQVLSRSRHDRRPGGASTRRVPPRRNARDWLLLVERQRFRCSASKTNA